MTDAKVRLHESTDSKPYYKMRDELIGLKKRHEETKKTVARQSASIQRMKEKILTLESKLSLYK